MLMGILAGPFSGNLASTAPVAASDGASLSVGDGRLEECGTGLSASIQTKNPPFRLRANNQLRSSLVGMQSI